MDHSSANTSLVDADRNVLDRVEMEPELVRSLVIGSSRTYRPSIEYLHHHMSIGILPPSLRSTTIGEGN